MRLQSLSTGLVSLGLAAGFLAGASGCSSDYGLFDVHVEFVSNVAADRDLVDACWLTVTNESGAKLLRYDIAPVPDVDQSVKSGCGVLDGGRTPRVVGDISYSTSRTSGKLKFTVHALDSKQKVLKNGCADGSIKVFHGTGDEQRVSVNLNDPSDACPNFED